MNILVANGYIPLLSMSSVRDSPITACFLLQS